MRVSNIVKISVVALFGLLILAYCLYCGSSWEVTLWCTLGFSGALGFMAAWMSIPGCFCSKVVVDRRDY